VNFGLGSVGRGEGRGVDGGGSMVATIPVEADARSPSGVDDDCGCGRRVLWSMRENVKKKVKKPTMIRVNL
jgi:hypothetical protein